MGALHAGGPAGGSRHNVSPSTGCTNPSGSLVQRPCAQKGTKRWHLWHRWECRAPCLHLHPPLITVLPPPVPQEDTKAHQELLKRVASSLKLQAEEVKEPSDSLFDVLSATAPARLALALHEGVVKNSTALWQTSSSLPRISKRAKWKYFVPAKGHEYLYTYPTPNSLVVEAVNHKKRQGQSIPTPKNKDSRRLDLFGRKLYSSSSFHLRVAYHQALLGRYDFNLWDSKFTDSLQERDRKEHKALVEEGIAAARASLQAASDAVDRAARTMASAVSMRRVLWLLLSGLSSEAQSSLQDLPFNDKALFAEQTDVKLYGLKDSCTTLKTLLGLYVLAPARTKFKPQQAPSQATRSQCKPPYKKPRDYKKHPQRQSRPAPQPGPSKGKQVNKRQF
ncbi:uncharacterized protein LOC135973045 [Chrysemys picta bellii]|uniref:uncharacterized protein LOC135973045 n=1 Tax=Chrysemys picta bellii TaxID=8478 RepID=UPI0032B2198E